MKRLEQYLKYGSIVRYPADVEKIMKSASYLNGCPLTLIEKMWKDYSESIAASWLIVDDDSLRNFLFWLAR